MSLNIQSIPYPEYTTTERDLLTNLPKGFNIFNTTDGEFQRYDGTIWSGGGGSSFKIQSTSTNSYASFENDGADEFITIKSTDGSLIAEFLDASDNPIMSLTQTKLVPPTLIERPSGTNLTIRAEDELNLEGYDGMRFGGKDAVSSGDYFQMDSINSVGSLTNTNEEQSYFGIYPQINQSGTAAYNALKIDVTETGLGDGSTGDGNNLLNLAIGGISLFKIDNTGAALFGDDNTKISNVGSPGEMTFEDAITGPYTLLEIVRSEWTLYFTSTFTQLELFHEVETSIIAAELGTKVSTIEYSINDGVDWASPSFPIAISSNTYTRWRVTAYTGSYTEGSIIIKGLKS